MNYAPDIVSKRLQHHLVDLRGLGSTAHGISEGPLNGGECGFDVGPLVIGGQKLLAMQHEVPEQLVPGWGRRGPNRITFERYEWLRALTDRQLKIGVGAISL